MSEFLDEAYPNERPQVKAVEFEAEVWQVKTMADGSVNIVLKLPEYCIDQATQLMKWHHLLVRCVAELQD